ncbi:sensor domain-containing diguanylate cyclase [Ferrovum myxofaciens]|uniref:diguanylate cyclase n=2 Tax=Ferrovum myxofaciens TaxID=416213 RepID=A0A149VYE1_9PROT|nr:HDOD domain-containing protein [Ferrovum myxofaciens]KXW58237.1 diguanylate cyclase DosC [Ferrovum myxofaciens]MBU6995185.1 HDOD domain-containing protein [Ferrovum myxofaciens]
MNDESVVPDTLAEDSLLLQIRALGHLPSPSSTALRLYALIQSEDVDLHKVAEVIKRDVALTVRLIRMANRPGGTPGRPVASVEEGLMRIGLKTVAGLAVGLSVIDDAVASSAPDASAYLALCRHSLAAAVLAEWMCDRPEIPVSAADLFTCALLARIGQLALLRFYPEPYSVLLRLNQNTHELLDAEREQLGIDHQAITLALLQEWGFPDPLTEAIRISEAEPELRVGNDRSHVMAQILNFAWEAAPALISRHTEKINGYLEHGLALLGQSVSTEELPGMVEDIIGHWQEWGSHTPGHDSSNKDIAPNSGEAESVTTRLLLVGVPLAIRQSWESTFAGRGYGVLNVDSWGAVTTQMTNESVGFLIIWQDEPHILGEQEKRLFESWTGEEQRAIVVLVPELNAPFAQELLEIGADIVLPCTVSVPLLGAQLARLEGKLVVARNLEAERSTHRKLLSELVLTTRKLHLQTLTDPLTGLANRRMAEAFLKRHWFQVERRNLPLGVLIIDLDDFKRINDKFGHDAGDAALRAFATVLKENVRQEDLAVRLGGDEFLVVCPLAQVSNLEYLRKRLIEVARQLTLETGPLSCSIGFAESDRNTMKSPSELLKQADEHLMRLKRNRPGKG